MAEKRVSSSETSRDLAASYDAFYYAHNCGRPYERDDEWLNFFGSIAERIVRDIGPGTVLDAGCAMGFLVETLRRRGVDAVGIDISQYAIEKVHADSKAYCSLGSVTEELSQRYDLIVSIEVLEHLLPAEADRAIENFCKHTEDILFSSTPFDYKEATHLNVRPPDYWAQRFARHGFYRDLDFDGSFITPWTIRLRKTHDPAWRVVSDYERYLWQVEKEIQARRQLTVEQQTQLAEHDRKLQAALAEKDQALQAALAEKDQALQVALAEKDEALQAALAEKDQALQVALAEKDETLQTALAKKDEVLQPLSAEIAKHHETIESLTAALNQEQEQSQQLLAKQAERAEVDAQVAAQLAAQYEKLDALIAPVVTGQSALDGAVADLLEKRNTIDGLVDQLAAKETTVSSLNSEIARREEAIEIARADLEGRRASEHKLELELAESRTALAESRRAIETFLAAQQQAEQAMQTLLGDAAQKDQTISVLASEQKTAEVTINALSQRRAEAEQASERLSATLVEKDVMLAHREARLVDIDSSLAWWAYNRIKYPYLMAFYRLYERIKYPYLLSVYRRLGLVPHKPTPRAIPAPESQASLPPSTTFPLTEVSAPATLLPHTASVDVIVCVHNALDDVKRCLQSVVYYTRTPYSLIIVDDGSDDETTAYLSSFARSQDAVLIRNEQAKGYTLAANQGLRRSEGDYALLLNSDTVVTPLWLDRMVACGESDPRIGLVGPLSNVASWQSIPDITRNGDWAENSLPEGFSVADMGNLVGRQSARLYPRIPFLNGFCLMIKRSVMDQIGYFDEEAFGKGYGEENDYSLRARNAGWQLRVVDDAYVYHAQSRSYSHERRKELSKHADVALRKKHEPQMIMDGVMKCQSDRLLQGIRARSRTMLERRQLIEKGMKTWEGKEVLFILTLNSACGGGNVVLDEAEAMRKMGVNTRILNLNRNRAAFEQSYPDCTIPVMYVEDQGDIAELTGDFDAVIATANDTVYWLTDSSPGKKQPIRSYYVQDFEPDFYDPEAPGFKIALDSYTEYSDLIRFTKTEWNRDAVKRNTGADCVVVGPSVNVDLYRPRRRRDPDWPSRPLRVAAMIRPSTPRRNAKLTMEVLREYQRAHGETVEIILFGCETSDPAFRNLPRDFAWRNAGMLTRSQLAFLMNEIDIFADFSKFQAMGLTAMEAMACGAAVIVPKKGGASSFAAQNQNALIVDTNSVAACVQVLRRLTLDESLRTKLQQKALVDVCQHYPERAAFNTLAAIFPTAS